MLIELFASSSFAENIANINQGIRPIVLGLVHPLSKGACQKVGLEFNLKLCFIKMGGFVFISRSNGPITDIVCNTQFGLGATLEISRLMFRVSVHREEVYGKHNTAAPQANQGSFMGRAGNRADGDGGSPSSLFRKIETFIGIRIIGSIRVGVCLDVVCCPDHFTIDSVRSGCYDNFLTDYTRINIRPAIHASLTLF